MSVCGRCRRFAGRKSTVTDVLDGYVPACLDGRVRVWDARTGDIAREFIGHAASLLDMALNQDGTAIITGADDGTCRIFTMQQ